MCFYNDYDWYADTVVETCCRCPVVECTCYECGEPIGLGDWCYGVYQEEHECCAVCEDTHDEFGRYDPEQDPETCEHDYGETYGYVRCVTCSKLLHAIEEQETDEGCPPLVRQPALEELREALSYGTVEYATKAVAMYPELRDHDWLSDSLEVIADGEE